MVLITFVAGLVLLILGADLLVRGASRLSLSLGITPLMVGLTVVAFGTSAPELAISVKGALAGQTDIALGNVVGSNILNVLCVLGIAALMAPLVVDRQLVRQEVPILIAVSAAVAWMAHDGRVSALDGALLFAAMLAYTALLYWQGRHAPHAPTAAALAKPASGAMSRLPVQLALIAAGFGMLVLGSQWLVDSATIFAKALGVSELLIGLTIVALGTSLPEIATSVVAALRGEREIAVGNVLGSCIFNLMAVLGISAMVSGAGLPVPPTLMAFDIPVMVAVAAACLPLLFTGHRVARWEGALLLSYYAAYVAYLVLYSRQSSALDDYSDVMITAVIPATALALAFLAWREFTSRRGLPH